jgi:hypothetical protein
MTPFPGDPGVGYARPFPSSPDRATRPRVANRGCRSWVRRHPRSGRCLRPLGRPWPANPGPDAGPGLVLDRSLSRDRGLRGCAGGARRFLRRPPGPHRKIQCDPWNGRPGRRGHAERVGDRLGACAQPVPMWTEAPAFASWPPAAPCWVRHRSKQTRRCRCRCRCRLLRAETRRRFRGPHVHVRLDGDGRRLSHRCRWEIPPCRRNWGGRPRSRPTLVRAWRDLPAEGAA